MSINTFLAPLQLVVGDLVIRAYRPGDGPALQRSAVASYEHLRPWMPWAKAEQTVEESELFVRGAAGRYLLGEEFTLGIWRGDELAGGTGYHLRHGNISSGNAEVGMWISAAHAGSGLGTHVLRSLLGWGFTAWPWQRIVWRCDTRNLASARVAKKCGLVLEGTARADAFDVAGGRRDTHTYAILRAEWERRRGA